VVTAGFDARSPKVQSLCAIFFLAGHKDHHPQGVNSVDEVVGGGSGIRGAVLRRVDVQTSAARR